MNDMMAPAPAMMADTADDAFATDMMMHHEVCLHLAFLPAQLCACNCA